MIWWQHDLQYSNQLNRSPISWWRFRFDRHCLVRAFINIYEFWFFISDFCKPFCKVGELQFNRCSNYFFLLYVINAKSYKFYGSNHSSRKPFKIDSKCFRLMFYHIADRKILPIYYGNIFYHIFEFPAAQNSAVYSGIFADCFRVFAVHHSLCTFRTRLLFINSKNFW